MKKAQKGVAPALALIVLAILAILVSAGAYYLLKGTGQYPSESTTRSLDYTQPQTVSEGEEIPVSDSDKTSDIEAELESTDLGDFESDIEGLELDANSL